MDGPNLDHINSPVPQEEELRAAYRERYLREPTEADMPFLRMFPDDADRGMQYLEDIRRIIHIVFDQYFEEHNRIVPAVPSKYMP